MRSAAGVVVIAGVVFTAAGLVYTSRTLRVTEEGQITDRYTKTIEQLGSDKPEVRMGGIYALERLMTDSSRDRRTVIDVLAAYVRTHAQDRPPAGSPSLRLAVDVQAAFTVIGRNRFADLTETVDLASANLTGALLTGADLRGADLTGADLGANTPDQIRRTVRTDKDTRF